MTAIITVDAATKDVTVESIFYDEQFRAKDILTTRVSKGEVRTITIRAGCYLRVIESDSQEDCFPEWAKDSNSKTGGTA
jgi:hypothetical protein